MGRKESNQTNKQNCKIKCIEESLVYKVLNIINSLFQRLFQLIFWKMGVGEREIRFAFAIVYVLESMTRNVKPL